MSGIYKDDSWSLGKLAMNDQEHFVRIRNFLPSAPDRELYPNLILISWTYPAGPSGLPTAETAQLMQEFENAIESTLEAKGLAVLAACLTGSGTKEWRYYTSDKEEFIASSMPVLKVTLHIPSECNSLLTRNGKLLPNCWQRAPDPSRDQGPLLALSGANHCSLERRQLGRKRTH